MEPPRHRRAWGVALGALGCLSLAVADAPRVVETQDAARPAYLDAERDFEARAPPISSRG